MELDRLHVKRLLVKLNFFATSVNKTFQCMVRNFIRRFEDVSNSRLGSEVGASALWDNCIVGDRFPLNSAELSFLPHALE